MHCGLLLVVLLLPATFSEVVVTPEMFGAVGDGQANDWGPIKQALTACFAAVYNGTTTIHQSCRVRFTKEYLSGPLVLSSSQTTLEFRSGSTLAMLPKSQYSKACPEKGCPFIATGEGAEGCRTVHPNPHAPGEGYEVCLHDVTITGGGTIDGAANWGPESWWLCARLQSPAPSCWRPAFAIFDRVAGLTINGTLTLKDSPAHFIRL